MPNTWLNKFFINSLRHRFSLASNLKFFVDVFDVRANGIDADVELRSNKFIAIAFR